MNTPQLFEPENVLRAAERMQRVGLIIDRTTLSPAFRRAWFQLQCQLAEAVETSASNGELIGFAYPTRQSSNRGS